jgi:hypothetical protein
VKVPEGPASSGDRRREPVIPVAVMPPGWYPQRLHPPSASSESAARAFPFPLLVLSSFSGSNQGGLFKMERADERMIKASWKLTQVSKGMLGHQSCWES